MKAIEIRGARTHNLKNLDLSLPRDQFIVITGPSGSGKSSLAFDTLYAEGQRRYVESLSAYARQFLSMMDKPDVDHIDGLSPAISIEQKTASHNPRSTVGTITEIHDYLRLLFARVGEPRCPVHQLTLEAQTVSQMVDEVLALPADTKAMILAPVIHQRKGEHVEVIEKLRAQGFIRARIDGAMVELDDPPKLALRKKHSIEVVIDRFKVRDELRTRLAESFETAIRLGEGQALLVFMEGDQPEKIFSSEYACPHCGYSLAELEPRLFSFNSPQGACPTCDGLGVKQFFDEAHVLSDANLSLSEGAIRGWDKQSPYYFALIEALAKHFHFSVHIPFKKLPKRIQRIIFYGSEDESIRVRYESQSLSIDRHQHFEGVIPNLERRYRETESEGTREELAKFLSQQVCDDCQGARLCEAARHVFINGYTLPDVNRMAIDVCYDFFKNLKLQGKRAAIAEKILKEIGERLYFLVNVGLNYLNLARSAETLSGGEAQRIRLASQIGAGLVGVMYILDEPSIGLHQRDNERLLQSLLRLRDLGNTVIVVEHDEDAMRHADHIVDMGPGAGVHGGAVVVQGSLEDILAEPHSLTGNYLSGKRRIEIPGARRPFDKKRVLKLTGVRCNNLNKVEVSIPLGLFTCVTGVSGSGKSSLINDTLYPAIAKVLHQSNGRILGDFDSLEGLDAIDKVIDIDQNPIGRTPRSNPATYTGLFTPIRELFAATTEARARGYTPGRFSFNVKGGRCEACQGDGLIKVEMHFLPDVYVLCDVCKGQRYNRETLEVHYKGKNIHEVLGMTIEDAREFFDAIPVIAKKLQTLMDVGLGYVQLGQSATTLSGGEAQRVKLSRELAKRSTGKTLYLLDEPTTGLHFHDIEQLLKVLHRLRDEGNTIVVIEHNLDVIKTADWIIDLGPEGGDQGGQIIATGTPEEVAMVSRSYTGQFLKALLKIKIPKSKSSIRARI